MRGSPRQICVIRLHIFTLVILVEKLQVCVNLVTHGADALSFCLPVLPFARRHGCVSARLSKVIGLRRSLYRIDIVRWLFFFCRFQTIDISVSGIGNVCVPQRLEKLENLVSIFKSAKNVLLRARA